MIIQRYAQTRNEYISSDNDQWWEVLLELFDHTINKHLSNSAENAHQKHLKGENMMIVEKR